MTIFSTVIPFVIGPIARPLQFFCRTMLLVIKSHILQNTVKCSRLLFHIQMS